MRTRFKRFFLVSVCFSFLLLWTRPALSIENTDVILTDPSVGVMTSVIISFKVTASETWGNTGSIEITFPLGFVVNAVGPADSSAVEGIDGGFNSTVVTGLTVTSRRDGTGTTLNDVDCKYKIDNIVNPSVIGATGTFLVQLLNSGGGVISNDLADGVVISDPLILGNGSNHSKFCVIGVLTENPLTSVFAFFVLVTALGLRIQGNRIISE